MQAIPVDTMGGSLGTWPLRRLAVLRRARNRLVDSGIGRCRHRGAELAQRMR